MKNDFMPVCLNEVYELDIGSSMGERGNLKERLSQSSNGKSAALRYTR